MFGNHNRLYRKMVYVPRRTPVSIDGTVFRLWIRVLLLILLPQYNF